MRIGWFIMHHRLNIVIVDDISPEVRWTHISNRLLGNAGSRRYPVSRKCPCKAIISGRPHQVLCYLDMLVLGDIIQLAYLSLAC